MPMKRFLESFALRVFSLVTRPIGRMTGRYYFEDYVRVYPDGLLFDPIGRRRYPQKRHVNNFLNHCKFYRFATQFVQGKRVADVGCGSGYGCEILMQGGAAQVCGSDISARAIEFAKFRFSEYADFSIQPITDLKGYPDDSFDVSVSNEVLEHTKEYAMHDEAVRELKRITRPGGLLIVATPNSELRTPFRLHGSHGFFFDEIDDLFRRHFPRYCIFENALIPFGDGKAKALWEKRMFQGKTGIVISEKINLSETVLPEDLEPETKKGLDPGRFQFATYEVDTTLLHNTHSWVVIAMKE